MRSDLHAARRAIAHSKLADQAEILGERFLDAGKESAAGVRSVQTPYPHYRELFLLEAVADFLEQIVEVTEPVPEPTTPPKPAPKKPRRKAKPKEA